jgi:serine/threonine-protein kinase HipA
MFGQPTAPVLPYSELDLEPLAREVIQSQTAVTGVQPKLSLHLSGRDEHGARRFTIVGLWGGFILKPPSSNYPGLPEVEDLTMHLAQHIGIPTAAHSLIRLQSGNLAYLTRRMDREGQRKLAMEDLCQLSERLTEDKYRGSYEQIGRLLLNYSTTPGLDLVNFFELVLFCFLTGNADMHLKNFALLEQPRLGMALSPAYDLVNTSLVNPSDDEELALTLNGKKRKLRKQDFIAAMGNLRLSAKQQENIFNKLLSAQPRWADLMDRSFLNEAMKMRYKEIVAERVGRLWRA